VRVNDKSKTLAAGATVALATSGLSSCQDNGAVDPPPPPLECNSVGRGETLSAAGSLAGRQLRVVVGATNGALTGVQISSVVGGVARPVEASAFSVTVVIDLDPGVASGSFTLAGTLEGFPAARCPVVRTFTFTLGPAGVVVASTGDLPLPARQQARIMMVAREGHEVELEATTPFQGPHTVLWTVTGGEVVSREGARLRWRLPDAAGLYQAELAVDYGRSGLSFDTLVLEVL
jgi:hypothetical protein